MGPLAAVEPRAAATADPDRHGQRRVADVDAIRIDHGRRMGDMAAQADGEIAPRRIVAVATLDDRAGDAEIALPLRHLADLDVDLFGMEEGGIDVPARAGARMAGDMDPR